MSIEEQFPIGARVSYFGHASDHEHAEGTVVGYDENLLGWTMIDFVTDDGQRLGGYASELTLIPAAVAMLREWRVRVSTYDVYYYIVKATSAEDARKKIGKYYSQKLIPLDAQQLAEDVTIEELEYGDDVAMVVNVYPGNL